MTLTTRATLTTRVIRILEHGGPDRLETADIDLADPGPGQIRVRQTAIGLNFIDIYQRSGLYPLPGLPAVLGIEAAGVVEAIGPDVDDLAVGQRIAYAGAVGAYAAARLLPAWRALPVPAEISDPVAATALARGITAHMLQTRIYAVGAESTVLVHSAAGGLGSLLVRFARRRGATVIGTVGSAAKADIARAAGADHVIVGRDADFGREVAALTGGAGVDVAYDGVGGDTLRRTLDCVRPFGTVASFGQSAGPIPPLAVEELGPRRSLLLARPSVMHYMAEPAAYRVAAAAVLEAAASGIAPTVGRAYPLDQAAAAHIDLESGTTTGCALLLPP
jgi:NADPH2:quinone reductase